MSYEARVDEMVVKHVKIFQDELSLAKIMETHAKVRSAMPYGYPIAVYCPLHICRFPKAKKYVARAADKLSNGVPKVLAMEIVNQYILGVYNPPHVFRARSAGQRASDESGHDRTGPKVLAWVRSLQSNQFLAAQRSSCPGASEA